MSTPAERGVTVVESTPAQILAGTKIGAGERGQCTHCARTIGETSHVALRVHKLSDEARWSSAAVACCECIETHGTIAAPTAGAAELVVSGSLALRSDPHAQRHWLIFQPDRGGSAVLDFSPADEGDEPRS
jgi:hypothetical protein